MNVENSTSVDQLHALWLRTWNHLKDRIPEFERDKVQGAVAEADHPFWTLFHRAADVFMPVMEIILLDTVLTIKVGDRRTPGEIIATLPEPWDKAVTREARAIFESSSFSTQVLGQPQDTDIVFLYPTQPLTLPQVLEEFKKRGLENVCLDDSLRLLELDVNILAAAKSEKYYHDIVFINERDLTQSLKISADGMGCRWVDRADHDVSGCYAARRKRTVSV